MRLVFLLILGPALFLICNVIAQDTLITGTQRAPNQEPSSKSLLHNGSFEEGNGLPKGWQQGQQIPGVQYIWTKAVAYEGQACVCLKKTVQKYFPIAEWFQTVPHTGTAPKLKVSAWVKAQQVHKAIIDVQFTSFDGKWSHQWAAYIGAKQTGDPSANHDWKQYSGVVPIPEGTKKIKIALQIYGPGVVGFDNVSASYVEQTAAPTSVQSIEQTAKPMKLTLTNPDFETGVSVPNGWRKGAPIPGVQYIWDRKVAYEGQASLCLKKTAQKYFPIAQWFQPVPHTGTASKLKVSAWVKAQRAYKATLDVQFTSQSGKWSHQWAAYIGAKNAGDPPAHHDWKQLSGVVSIPPGTKDITIALQIYGPGTLWFDNIDAEYIR